MQIFYFIISAQLNNPTSIFADFACITIKRRCFWLQISEEKKQNLVSFYDIIVMFN